MAILGYHASHEQFRPGTLLSHVKTAERAGADSDEEAERAAHEQWRPNVLAPPVLAALRMPAEFDAAAEYVEPADLHDAIRISSDLERHADWIAEAFELGFSEILLHCVHRDQERFICDFGEHVLPRFHR
jgi:coenzyme F420-dependent glucose-6-phosphate dehydrogenase